MPTDSRESQGEQWSDPPYHQSPCQVANPEHLALFAELPKVLVSIFA